MIDLTKPITVYGIQAPAGTRDDRNPNALIFGQEIDGSLHIPAAGEEFEAYRFLFQDAPRTKLEHGKMLALLKRMVGGPGVPLPRGGMAPRVTGYQLPDNTILSAVDIYALIDEIEGNGK